jgi:hypothetical protein
MMEMKLVPKDVQELRNQHESPNIEMFVFQNQKTGGFMKGPAVLWTVVSCMVFCNVHSKKSLGFFF